MLTDGAFAYEAKVPVSLDWAAELSDGPHGFFLELYPRLYSFVSKQTHGPHEEVEDIVQETLYHAWRDRHSFNGQSDVVTWISGIAKNRLREHRRKETRRQKAMKRVANAVSDLNSSEIPEDLVETVEFKAKVLGVLGALEKKAADVLFRCYYDDKSIKEIAAESGESEDAVESRLRRAREFFLLLLRRGDQDAIA